MKPNTDKLDETIVTASTDAEHMAIPLGEAVIGHL